MSEFQSSAVENTMLNLLIASETNYDYPALEPDAVDTLATNLSDIIYTTLKQKSSASATKRSNVLKLLNNICQTPESHLTEDHYKIYLKAYEQEFCKTNSPEADDLLQTISKQLEDISSDLHGKVLNFYKLKNARQKDKIQRQEFIKKLDQDKLSSSFGMHYLVKNISHYETSEGLIDDLLKTECAVSKPISIQSNSGTYRDKQVRFCYALINIANDDYNMKILESLLKKLCTYVILERFELKLLLDLWLLGVYYQLDLSKFITNNFPFIVEKLVIQFCTEIIKLRDEAEVSKYFTDLVNNPKIVRLQDVCAKNLSFYYKLKDVINELFVFSYCNENVCRFADYII